MTVPSRFSMKKAPATSREIAVARERDIGGRQQER
jgi:hypothetical protein